jgi:hypothetical protein
MHPKFNAGARFKFTLVKEGYVRSGPPPKTQGRSGTSRTAQWKPSLIYRGSGWRSSLLSRVHADEPPVPTLILELHDAGDQRKEGVIFALSDIHAGLMLGPALTHQNGAGIHVLPAKSLDAQPLSM